MLTMKKNAAGVTLIELMVVMVIAAVLVAGVYSLFITQHRSYAVQDQVVGVQQDARAALDIMAREIRMAGVGIGAGSDTGFTDGSNSITISSNPSGDTYRFAVEPRNSSAAPDRLTVVLGAEALGTISGVTGNTVTLTSAAPTTTPVLFSFDLLPGRLYQGTMSDSTTIAITSTGFPSGTGKIIGGKAYGVHAITYSVTASDGNPVGVGVLRRNENTGSGAQPLAGDGTTTFVEDLQFAYQVAGDATNWHNTSAEAGTTNDNITMVRINLVVRTAVEDAKDQNYTRPSLEDHPGSGTKDGYRRRVYTTDVKVRNL